MPNDGIDGYKELMSYLNVLGKEITDEVHKTVARGARSIQRDAKMLAPVDSGKLRDSIVTETEITEESIMAEVGTNLDYAAYVEFGTGPVGEENRGIHGKTEGIAYKQKGWIYHDGEKFVYTRGQPPKPYLYPAYKANEGQVKDDVLRAVKRVLKKR